MKGKKLKTKEVNSKLRTPNSKLFFILGGARSGKSAYALKLAESITGKRLYLATAEALDKEMAERIKKHKKERSNRWETKEEPIKVAEAIAQDKKHNVILLDCLTLWISNLMHNSAIRNPQSAISKLVSASKNSKANIIVVSNEVGLGIVPDNPLARRFRDIAGYANQKMAEAADEVYFVVSRIGMRMK